MDIANKIRMGELAKLEGGAEHPKHLVKVDLVASKFFVQRFPYFGESFKRGTFHCTTSIKCQ